MRRSFFLLASWFLFRAPARGAEIAAVRAEPVQLSFSFAAAAALPLQSPSLAAAAPAALSVPASAPAALAPAAVPALQVAAVSPAPEAAVPAAPRRARSSKIDYEEFGRQIAARPGISQNVFQHAEAKRRILRASGYSVLYGAGGIRIPLEDASDARIGNVFANVLRAFNRL